MSNPVFPKTLLTTSADDLSKMSKRDFVEMVKQESRRNYEKLAAISNIFQGEDIRCVTLGSLSFILSWADRPSTAELIDLKKILSVMLRKTVAVLENIEDNKYNN
jgi:hypothetical protein